MHDVLFEMADSIGQKPWADFARAAGIKALPAFDGCMQDSTALMSVWSDTHTGDSLFIKETPTFLVNDRLFVGVPDSVGFDRYINDLIRRLR